MKWILSLLTLFSAAYASEYVAGGYIGGRLGNQLFQIAAVSSLAWDHNVEPVFPDYADWNQYGIPENMKNIFFRVSTHRPSTEPSMVFYEDQNFNYTPIPYTPNMKVYGFFQSELYFKNHKQKIVDLFQPHGSMDRHIREKYKDLLAHPNSVGVHLRAYEVEDPSIKNMLVPIGKNFVEKAAAHFSQDALFVVFSDDIEWAKKQLKGFSRPHIFIENENYFYDFYLLSFMKHQIISNSSFGWWAAYLNSNPEKMVVAPMPWFQPNWHIANGNKVIIAEGWLTIEP